MAKIGNEANLILRLVGEKWDRLKDSRLQTPDEGYRKGYGRAVDDYKLLLQQVLSDLESK